MIDRGYRNAVKSYSDLMLQLFPAVCLCCVQTGQPLLSSHPPFPLLALSPSAASSLRKVGACANDATLYTWEPEDQSYRDGAVERKALWDMESSVCCWSRGPRGDAAAPWCGGYRRGVSLKLQQDWACFLRLMFGNSSRVFVRSLPRDVPVSRFSSIQFHLTDFLK